jgi:TatA/E family protein of Tat protein translocase
MPLLFFEFLGTTELMVILVAALILFGPRKLPEISKQIGKGLAEFRKASDDFRQTWEKEVQREYTLKDLEADRTMLPESEPVTVNTIGRGQNEVTSSDSPAPSDAAAPADQAPVDQVATGHLAEPSSPVEEIAEPTRKRDWL